MPGTFTCHHCGKTFQRNPRIKKQIYCSCATCQNARRTTTNKSKLSRRVGSRRLRQARNKKWRDNYPAHKYQNQYRETHPEYVVGNREKQNKRNKKHQKSKPPMIVKTNAYMAATLKQQGIDMHFLQKPG
ncbi:MAG: hypothetical protein PHH93_05145 [Prolixibacteraceae bacterium]|nr:hypothetical protein [Prolixibacteraceae bacterium]